MKVFVTGIRGFLAYHLTKELINDGHQVLGIDNLFNPCAGKIPKNIWKWGDVRYYPTVSAYIANSDVVFHLAAQIHVDQSINDPVFTNDVNIGGTLNILEACRKFNKRLILASTSEVYGTALTPAISESHPLNPQSPYAASKVAADRLAFSYWKTYDIPVTIVRNFNFFGQYQAFNSYGGVIAKFTYEALHGRAPRIFGSGEQERDYMNSEDAVMAYKTAFSDNMIGKEVNFGTGKTVKINDLAKMIVKRINPSLIPEHVEPRPGEVQRLCADITLAKSLGFTSKTDFEKDLNKYIDWFQENQ